MSASRGVDSITMSTGTREVTLTPKQFDRAVEGIHRMAVATRTKGPVQKTLQAIGEDELAEIIADFEDKLRPLGLVMTGGVTVKNSGTPLKVTLGIEPTDERQMPLFG